jgi:NAD(P) transhydrogenase subunit beta
VNADVIDPIVRLIWLGGAVAFVIGLSRMSSPATARQGNLISAGGMTLAIAATALWLLVLPPTGTFNPTGWLIILAGIAVIFTVFAE